MDINYYIVKNIPWAKLPENIQLLIGNSDEYSKKIKEYSIVNQVVYKENLIRSVEKSQRSYYEQLLRYSKDHYMLFPYHLSQYIISGMRVTPFQYYQAILIQMIEQEKNYDTLPNFTAADCVRLMGIGRNQYIELMNQYKSSKKFLGMIKKPIKELLPNKPVDNLFIDFWWTIRTGYITEDDIKQMVTSNEKLLIDAVLNEKSKDFISGNFNYSDVLNLYIKGLIYFDILIDDNDLIFIPPLEGFVMNRTTGDYFETLLYKIFVSIDEKTTISELSNVLQIDLNLVKNAISMYCRLGFAFKKNNDINVNTCHTSWLKHLSSVSNMDKGVSQLKDISNFINSLNSVDEEKTSVKSNNTMSAIDTNSDNTIVDNGAPKSNLIESKIPISPSIMNSTNNNYKRIGLLFDSTLAAFLMMGNLTPGLKSHAVTMFEVGKLSDESMDNFTSELAKIKKFSVEEEGGEAERYFIHAIILCQTVQFLRNNFQLTKDLMDKQNNQKGLGLDLIRCESLLNLDKESCERLLCRNYELLISVAPLSNETQIFTSDLIPYFGASSFVNSIWFKLYLYTITMCGPPSMLLSKGVRLSQLPNIFFNYEALMITPWGRDAGIVSISNALIAINESTIYNPVLIQAYPQNSVNISDDQLIYIPLPFLHDIDNDEYVSKFSKHNAIINLQKHINLKEICGYFTFIKYKHNQKDTPDNDYQSWSLFDCHFGIPLFDRNLNQSVCERIQSNNLFAQENLKNVMKSNQKIFNDIGVFIRDFVDLDQITNNDFGDKVPLPSTCVIYSNGKIEKWTSS